MLTNLRAPTPQGCLSDLTLDEWHAGELAAPQVRAAAEHLDACPRCRERKQAMLANAQNFLAGFPPESLRRSGNAQSADRPTASPPRSRRSRWWAWGIAAGGLGAAAAVLLLARPAPRPREAGDESATRFKGGEHIGFFVKRQSQVFAGIDGQKVRAGDRLRFVVTTTRPRQLAILSRDGAGTASVYYPARPTSQPLGVVRDLALETAVELDATPGQEMLFGVFCAAAFQVEPLRGALAQTGDLPALSGCTVDKLRLVKETP
jgi:hypothetical protein